MYGNGEIQTGFSNFSNSLENTQRKLESASSEIDKASKLAAIIERKLHKVGEI